VTWVTPGKLLLRYVYGARALVEGDIAWRAAPSCRPIRAPAQRLRNDAQSNHQKLFGQGGARCGVQKGLVRHSEPKDQNKPNLAVNAKTSATRRSTAGTATGPFGECALKFCRLFTRAARDVATTKTSFPAQGTWLEFASQSAIFMGPIGAMLLGSGSRWGFVIGLATQPFWFYTPSVIANGASSLPVSSMPLPGRWVSTETSEVASFDGIRDEDEPLRIDGVKKLHLGPEKISNPLPGEGQNLAHDQLGLPAGRLIPDQLKATLPDRCEDTRGCAFRVKARCDEHVGIDYNPSHEHSSGTMEGLARGMSILLP
jgi:hypothetical protein